MGAERTIRGRKTRTREEKLAIVKAYYRAPAGKGGHVLYLNGVSYSQVWRWAHGLSLGKPGGKPGGKRKN